MSHLATLLTDEFSMLVILYLTYVFVMRESQCYDIINQDIGCSVKHRSGTDDNGLLNASYLTWSSIHVMMQSHKLLYSAGNSQFLLIIICLTLLHSIQMFTLNIDN